MSSVETEISTSPNLPDDTITSAASPSRHSPGKLYYDSLWHSWLVSDLMKDIYLWKKKKLSLAVLVISTATWVLLEIYGFNFIPVVCWVAIFIVTSIFLWGNLARLFHKEIPAISIWEVSEELTMFSRNALRVAAEEGILWMFRVGVEDKWFIFVGIVAGLWLLSMVAGFLSFISFSYIGVLIGMSVPFILFTYESNIKGFRDRMEAQGRRWFHRTTESEYKVAEDKVKNKVGEDKGKNKVAEDKGKKGKKVE
ncbi:reticulon-like protein B13 [Telopea speciosissima]|uniref:reticulon-like protein B13 n=1 Tax=Telopea speciosissima TaxID=54955 RepID=UPI001CC3C11E|nr:reticulon-like protein B13 [Telopea speciosissima]